MVNSHDGARLSALVDGELDHEAREQVLAHLTRCDECRAIVDAERRVRALVGSLGHEETAPAPSDALMANLLRMGEDAEPPAAVEHTLPAGRRPTKPSASGRRPRLAGAARTPDRGSRRCARHDAAKRVPETWSWPGTPALAGGGSRSLLQPGRRMALGVVGAASVAGVAAALAFSLGAEPADPPTVRITPPIQQFGFEHANTMNDAPLWDGSAVTESLRWSQRGADR